MNIGNQPPAGFSEPVAGAMPGAEMRQASQYEVKEGRLVRADPATGQEKVYNVKVGGNPAKANQLETIAKILNEQLSGVEIKSGEKLKMKLKPDSVVYYTKNQAGTLVGEKTTLTAANGERYTALSTAIRSLASKVDNVVTNALSQKPQENNAPLQKQNAPAQRQPEHTARHPHPGELLIDLAEEPEPSNLLSVSQSPLEQREMNKVPQEQVSELHNNATEDQVEKRDENTEVQEEEQQWDIDSFVSSLKAEFPDDSTHLAAVDNKTKPPEVSGSQDVKAETEVVKNDAENSESLEMLPQKEQESLVNTLSELFSEDEEADYSEDMGSVDALPAEVGEAPGEPVAQVGKAGEEVAIENPLTQMESHLLRRENEFRKNADFANELGVAITKLESGGKGEFFAKELAVMRALASASKEFKAAMATYMPNDKGNNAQGVLQLLNSKEFDNYQSRLIEYTAMYPDLAKKLNASDASVTQTGLSKQDQGRLDRDYLGKPQQRAGKMQLLLRNMIDDFDKAAKSAAESNLRSPDEGLKTAYEGAYAKGDQLASFTNKTLELGNVLQALKNGQRIVQTTTETVNDKGESKTITRLSSAPKTGMPGSKTRQGVDEGAINRITGLITELQAANISIGQELLQALLDTNSFNAELEKQPDLKEAVLNPNTGFLAKEAEIIRNRDQQPSST